MRKAWLAATAVCLFTAGWLRAGSIASPPAACPAGPVPLASYIALGATGCTVGGFTYWDFQFAVQPGSTATPIDASAVTVQTAAAATMLGIRFSGDFYVSGGQQVGYWLTYSIDPPPSIISGFEEALFPAPPVGSPPPIIRGDWDEMAMAFFTGPGSATILTDLCVGGLFTGGGATCSAALMALSVYQAPGGTQYLDWTMFPYLVNTVGVRHSILLDTGGPEGNAYFWALDNRAYLVPEPAGWLLGGCGLLMLLLRRRRAS